MYANVCASISSINLEESKDSVEHDIQSIFEKNKTNFDAFTDGSNLEQVASFRRKVVKLVCAQIMSKKLVKLKRYFKII